MTSNNKHILFWIVGVLVLFGLNLRRDMVAISGQIDWTLIERRNLHQSVSSPGVIEASNVHVIKSEVRENILKRFVKEGDKVKKGQLLMELSRTDTQLEFEQKKNSLQDSKADLKKAKRELLIQKKLFKNNAVPETQVEDAQQALRKTEAQNKIIEKEFALIKRKLESTYVQAPIDGVILKDHTKTVTRAEPDKELITMGDTSQFMVKSKVDELDIRQVSENQAVEITVDAFPKTPIRGVVEYIATQADREAFAKLEVLIRVTEDRGLKLKHNLSGRVDIITGEIPNALGVPTRAVQRKRESVGWVWVKSKWNIIREKKIKLGRNAGFYIEVTSGLKEGQSVGVLISNGSGS